jgi:hypothetical protein
MGRPSKKTPAVVEAIITGLSHGTPLAKICAADDMPHFQTVLRWEEEDEEFRALSARAREYGTHYIADDCIRIADDAELEPQDKRVRIDTRLRLIGKWNAKKYGDATTIKHADADGEKLQLDDVGRATRLAAIFAQIEQRKADDVAD